jgi:hypothetical protein
MNPALGLSFRNIKIIYLCYRNAYPAQKLEQRSAFSHRAFHFSGLRNPELDAYRGHPDRGFPFFHLEGPGSILSDGATRLPIAAP